MADVEPKANQPDCQCRHCQQTKTRREQDQLIINHGPYKSRHKFGKNEINRVSLPGDSDYDGVCLSSKTK